MNVSNISKHVTLKPLIQRIEWNWNTIYNIIVNNQLVYIGPCSCNYVTVFIVSKWSCSLWKSEVMSSRSSQIVHVLPRRWWRWNDFEVILAKSLPLASEQMYPVLEQRLNRSPEFTKFPNATPWATDARA